MEGGTPFGSASGLLYQSQSKVVKSRYVLPSELSGIADYEARYLAMAIHGLAEPMVSCIATANPSTLVRLLSVINRNPELIVRAIADGKLPDAIPTIDNFNGTLTPNKPRSKTLEAMWEVMGELSYADIWPHLKGLVTWTGGSCAVPLRTLSSLLPAPCKTIELGYIASEVRGTINVDVHNNQCLPAFMDTYFEFVDREAWEAGSADFLSLHELNKDRDYYVFVTTTEGLYRYDMDDIVRVTGKFNRTPILKFVQKGKGITSITGEKLHEAQVVKAVTEVLTKRGIKSDFFVMLADQEAAGYSLFVEPLSRYDNQKSGLSDELDQRLRTLNIEYDGKRSSGRLSPLKTHWLSSGAGDRYRKSRVEGGQRDAQFKYLHLQYAHECLFNFNDLSITK